MYVDERLSNELQMSELEAQDHDEEGWTPISGKGQSAASSSQMRASSSETGTEARAHHLEEQVKQMASSLDQVTKQLREMHLRK